MHTYALLTFFFLICFAQDRKTTFKLALVGGWGGNCLIPMSIFFSKKAY